MDAHFGTCASRSIKESHAFSSRWTIAEEVAEVFPELTVFNTDGKPETFKYHLLAPLLLNEYQKGASPDLRETFEPLPRRSTPKGLCNKAQGCRASGYWSDRAVLKGVKQPSGRLFHTFQPLI